MTKTAIITGVTGQDGAYLSKLLISKGYRVVGLSRQLTNAGTQGLKFLNVYNEIELKEIDLLDFEAVKQLISETKPSEIYNLAAQSSVGYSFEIPIETFSYNTASVMNLLESVRMIDKRIRFYQASSSEMFGNVSLKSLPIRESLLFHPASPYGISKASAHWLTVNYREAYGLFANCGILFNHESALRGDKFVIKKIIRSALEIKEGKRDSLTLGNLAIQRDWGYAPDYVEAMWLMLQKEVPDDYVICSGAFSSLQDIVLKVFDQLDLNLTTHLRLDKNFMRSLDLNVIYGDNTKAKKELNWKYNMSLDELVNRLISDEQELQIWEAQH